MHITIVTPQATQYHQQLKRRFPQFTWHHADQAAQLDTAGLQSQILLATPSDAAELVQQMPNIAWVHSTFAGVDALLADDLPRHYQLTNSRRVFGPLMSEYVFSYLLAMSQQHRAYRIQQQHKVWQARPHYSLQHRNFCCVGSGHISQHLASTAGHFNMKTSALSRSGAAQHPFQQVRPFSQHARLTPQADVVVSVLPATAATTGLLGEEFFQHLKEDVIFFNVGRGATVDHQALLGFLQQHPKAHAILDVSQPEPLPQDNPLWQLSNCTLTPHIAAPSRVEDIIELFADKLEAYHRGEPLSDQVDFLKGY